MKCFQFPTNILNCAVVHCHLLGPSCISKHLLQPLEQRSTFPKSQKASIMQIIPQHKTQKRIKKKASVCNHYLLNFRKIFPSNISERILLLFYKQSLPRNANTCIHTTHEHSSNFRAVKNAIPVVLSPNKSGYPPQAVNYCHPDLIL